MERDAVEPVRPVDVIVRPNRSMGFTAVAVGRPLCSSFVGRTVHIDGCDCQWIGCPPKDGPAQRGEGPRHGVTWLVFGSG